MSNIQQKKLVIKLLENATRTGTASRKTDLYHRAPSMVGKKQLANGKTFEIIGNDGITRTLLQTKGELNGTTGIFEYLIDPSGNISHQLFKHGRIIDGIIN